jgi:hypothetical protein
MHFPIFFEALKQAFGGYGTQAFGKVKEELWAK